MFTIKLCNCYRVYISPNNVFPNNLILKRVLVEYMLFIRTITLNEQNEL